MKLPNYFLADLPTEATVTATILSEACQTLKRNRDRFLAHRPTAALVRTLVEVARNWLNPDYALRQFALEQGPSTTGFSRTTIARGLDSFFQELTPEAFQALLVQDLGHADLLDKFCGGDTVGKTNRLAIASGPRFLVHVTAGNVPNPALMSMVLGLLLRSAQFVKCATGMALLPRLFAHSLYEADPKLGACIEVAEWTGGTENLDEAIFEEADCVAATGSDETLACIQERLRARVRFVGYGHRVSFAYVAADVLSGMALRNTLQSAVDDIVAWNQLGCLSPHVLYVQDGGTISPEMFAEALANDLDYREQTEPRGELPLPAAAIISSRRSIYELRAAHSPSTRLFCSKGSTAWSIVYETDPRFQLSCLHRFIYVKPVRDLAEALQNADAVRGEVSTVGVAAAEHKVQELALELAVWGAPRVCPLGRMQRPPLTWRHDGRLPLGELVTWTDWEQPQ